MDDAVTPDPLDPVEALRRAVEDWRDNPNGAARAYRIADLAEAALAPLPPAPSVPDDGSAGAALRRVLFLEGYINTLPFGADEQMAITEALTGRRVRPWVSARRTPAAPVPEGVPEDRTNEAGKWVRPCDECNGVGCDACGDHGWRILPADRIVPEGWRVEWGHSICTYPGCQGGELVNHRPPHEVTDLYPTIVACPRCLGSATRPGGPRPRLVPLPDTPHEEGAEDGE